jgi:hypothetical protein
MFTFTHTSDYSGQPTVQINLTSDAVSLPDILGNFEDFLRGCGFVFDGHITIVDEEFE